MSKEPKPTKSTIWFIDGTPTGAKYNKGQISTTSNKYTGRDDNGKYMFEKVVHKLEEKENYEFDATLNFDRWERLNCGARPVFEIGVSGCFVRMLQPDFLDFFAAKMFDGSTATGRWTYRKHGAEVGIIPAPKSTE